MAPGPPAFGVFGGMDYDDAYAYWLSAFHMSGVAVDRLTREEKRELNQGRIPTSRWGKEYAWWVEVSNDRAWVCDQIRNQQEPT